MGWLAAELGEFGWGPGCRGRAAGPTPAGEGIELTDTQWRAIQSLLPANGRPGGQWADHRTVVNGVLFRARTGRGALAGPAGVVRALADRL
ncbi:transposase [Streptomyces noursei]|uniref:transposase n=1 Tax=Streptomyces noursei TaxID=1971 RepID=UPI0019BD1EB7|nr:hypothetical protein GCM10010341_51020 [Streptomyces noursei]